jgi:uncharacterized protein with PIN domain
MRDAYDAVQRRALERALRKGGPLACPVCGAELSRQPVQRSPEVAYVRRRVWVVCPGCRRSASLDVKP